MLGTAPEVISGYFDADARHDVDASSPAGNSIKQLHIAP
jgi:hypothetical protein